MKIWYVCDKYDDDLIYSEDTKFYLNRVDAEREWYELEEKAKRAFYANQEKCKERWETDELVIQSCEEIGIEWKKGRLMFHPRVWDDQTWSPSTVVRSIEVIE